MKKLFIFSACLVAMSVAATAQDVVRPGKGTPASNVAVPQQNAEHAVPVRRASARVVPEGSKPATARPVTPAAKPAQPHNATDLKNRPADKK